MLTRLRAVSALSVLVLTLAACAPTAPATPAAKPTEPAAAKPAAQASPAAAKPATAASPAPAAKPTNEVAAIPPAVAPTVPPSLALSPQAKPAASPAAAAAMKPCTPPRPTASGYPNRPITVIVPYAAGGGTDIMFRAIDKIAQDLKLFPQPFVITNVTGGSGFTGKAQAIARPADGYTLTVADDPNIFGQVLGQAPMPYTAFTYVSRMVEDYNLVIVKNDSPFKTLKDWLDAAKAKPGEVTVGGTGIGNNDHVQLANIEQKSGTSFNYISFDSGGQVMTNLLGGQVQSALANPSEAFEQMRAGTVRALGITAPSRLEALPNVPTLREQGVDYVVAQFRGVAGPKGIPADVVAYLEAAFNCVAQSPAWKTEYLDKYQQMNGYMGAAEFQQFMDETFKETEQAFKQLPALQRR